MSADVNYKSNFVSYVLADRDVIIDLYLRGTIHILASY